MRPLARRVVRQSLGHVENRDDVQHCQRADAVGLIQREPVRDTRAAIVADDGVMRDAELVHRVGNDTRHRAFTELAVSDRRV
jgi:hypothetical protein